MAGFFILVLAIFLAQYWYVFVGSAALYALWRWAFVPWREREAQAAADRLRHERVRREMDDVALATTRAMVAVAREAPYPDVVEGTAEEWLS